MTAPLSTFARSLRAETAFTVLAIAKRLQAAGKDVVELEIGDSPFPTPAVAKSAGVEAIRNDHSRYCPSPGLPELREAAATYVSRELGLRATPDNIVVGPGAKVFEQYFCEAFLDPGDGVLVFSPHFPTYVPNIERRGARAVLSPLRRANAFRPDPGDVERFLDEDPSPRAVFLNSPHNPTGGVATQADLSAVAHLAREREIAVFSDEPYCHMVWNGEHRSIMAEPEMLDHGLAAYTFSKSYSMGGWRLGFCVTSPRTADRIATMVNTSLSCTPPFVQMAGVAALRLGGSAREETMGRFREKVRILTAGLDRIDGFRAPEPRATFYVFPDVGEACNRLGITSHGLALYLLEGADDAFGVACLGGECFGSAGAGSLRFSCGAQDERISQAVSFIEDAIARVARVRAYLRSRPELRLEEPYASEAVLHRS